MIDFTQIDEARVENRRRLANYVTRNYQRPVISERTIRVASHEMTALKINGIPVHMGTLMLLYADIPELMKLAKAGRIGYLRG